MRACVILYVVVCMSRRDHNWSNCCGTMCWPQAQYPLDPILCRVVLAAGQYSQRCVFDVVAIVAMLSVQSIFYTPRQPAEQALAAQAKHRFTSADGDHLTLLNVYNGFARAGLGQSAGSQATSNIELSLDFAGSSQSRVKPSALLTGKQRERERLWCEDQFLNYRSLSQARDIRHQLLQMYESHTPRGTLISEKEVAGASDSLTTQDHAECIRKSFLAGFFMHTAQRQPDGSYQTLADRQTVYVHPASTLHRKLPEHVFYNELVVTTKQYIRDVTVFDMRWLPDVAPRTFRPVVAALAATTGVGAGMVPAAAGAVGASGTPSGRSMAFGLGLGLGPGPGVMRELEAGRSGTSGSVQAPRGGNTGLRASSMARGVVTTWVPRGTRGDHKSSHAASQVSVTGHGHGQ
jgi:hypothetical protein